MTLLFCDSFDHYTDPSPKYSTLNFGAGGASYSIGSSYGRFGNGVRMAVNDGGSSYFQMNSIYPSVTTAHIGFAFRVTNSSCAMVQFLEGSTVHTDLRFNTSGYLYATRNGTSIGTSSGIWIQYNRWYYIEAKTFINGSTGTFQAYVDGALALDLTGKNTQNGGSGVITGFRIGPISVSGGNMSGVDFDDLVVFDTNGSTNNTYLGDVRVEALFPNGNSAITNQWVGSDTNSTDNYLLVDETAPATGDFVESSTVGDRDLYAYTNLTSTTGTVHGVQVLPYAAKTDAGTRQVAALAESGGSETVGSTKTLSTTALYLPEIMETKPGGGAWDITSVNAAEFGIKVIA